MKINSLFGLSNVQNIGYRHEDYQLYKLNLP